jgi:transcription-repair coupling factor (superfamily II helicase)
MHVRLGEKDKILSLNSKTTSPPDWLDRLVRDVRAPTPGSVAVLPGCFGASDAVLIAALAHGERSQGAVLALVTAAATDAQRLSEEVAWLQPDLRIRVLPDWETLPWDHFSPHDDLISERLATLHALQQSKVDLLLLSTTTALHRLAPACFVASRSFSFKRGQRIDEAALRTQLVSAGYEHVEQVVHPGEYCIRGGLVDLFPMGSHLPFRLDLFGDELDSIRTFDPDTQRSLYPTQEIQLLPGREFPSDEAARNTFRARWRERFEGDPSRSAIYRDVGNGLAPPGIEYWMPLFHEQMATVFDYLPANARVLTHGDVDRTGRTFAQDVAQRHRFLAHDSERPLLSPEELFIDIDEFFAQAKRRGRWSLTRRDSALLALEDVPLANETEPAAGSPTISKDPADSTRAAGEPRLDAGERRRSFGVELPRVAVNRRADLPLASLEHFLSIRPAGERTLILADSPGRRETLAQMLAEGGLGCPVLESWLDFAAGSDPMALGAGPLTEGFYLPSIGLSVITESELFTGSARGTRRGRKETATNVDALIRDLAELKVGDPVVHSQHGIGRYQGLVTLDLGDGHTEFLHLVYANDASLYVPVDQLHLIGRYSGTHPDEAPLHLLGSNQWEKARKRAAQHARDAAAELLNLYARRAARTGHPFRFNARDYEAFAEGFGFEETADQLAAIHAVIQDMISPKPMDRLVCGDVGFGKTEVALRAAFLAVSDGLQVAVLCPTTLLAEQHFRTFSDRFADFPVRLTELSRFRSARETREAVEHINEGKIDIVIGTHKLLSESLKFSRLGLVIIDEEHRFGVRQKEALKALRAEVDVLTLTATPIPRTLAMSLEGIRDFSVIATAPQKRLAIRTFVRKESSATIREAILRELKRGGQAYFLHNEVETIENRRVRLAELIPEARIAIAHGQMPERELERVMRDFHQQRFNVLLCTTIIETGIDIPTANTIVIHRADRFGLAQLHQLRGRVGRSHHQAYAYLMIPDESAITRDASKRLEAIQAMEELGAGFYLAMHDLEIRGAGEVLGDSQSGEIQEVGFAMYSDMLNEAVRALKDGREPDLMAPLGATTEIKLHVPALLPADYCHDVHERLSLYKRLASTQSQDDLQALQEELIDRFGRLPEPAEALLETHRLRLQCSALGIARIDAAAEAVVIGFVPKPPIDASRIIALLQSRRDARMSGPDRIRFTVSTADLNARLKLIREILRALSTPQGGRARV